MLSGIMFLLMFFDILKTLQLPYKKHIAHVLFGHFSTHVYSA